MMTKYPVVEMGLGASNDAREGKERGTMTNTRNDRQLARLGLLMLTLNFPRGCTGYMDLFTARTISPVIESHWLSRVCATNPGKHVSERYAAALNEQEQ